jgi:hypothetical protein
MAIVPSLDERDGTKRDVFVMRAPWCMRRDTGEASTSFLSRYVGAICHSHADFPTPAPWPQRSRQRTLLERTQLGAKCSPHTRVYVITLHYCSC